MRNILVVEDSLESFELIRRSLGLSFSFSWARTLEDGFKKLKGGTFDLVLLDVNLPDGNSFSLCSVAQSVGSRVIAPVIFITSRDDIGAKLLAFSIGADDYLVKPFEPAELKARVITKLKHQSDQVERSDFLRSRSFELQLATRKLQLTVGGRTQIIELTPLEFKIFAYLMKRPETVTSREELKNALWGKDFYADLRNIDTHVSKLRAKLGEMAVAVKSHHGFGYYFSEPVIENSVDHFSRASALSSAFTLASGV